MSYPTIQFTSSKLPSDFDWKTYLEINDDVKKVYNDEEGATKHYLRDGMRQRRLYKTINVPKKFDWEVYLGLNHDVYTVCKTKLAAIMHFEKHGYSENRKYTLKHGDIKEDFHWKKYVLKNPSLKSIHNKIDAICHYYKIGKKQNLSYEYDLPETEQVPHDFDWRIYCELNDDVNTHCNDKESAEQHYLDEGLEQQRRYKVPKSEIPEDFDWRTYLELNPDIKQIYPNETLAKLHYFITGKNEKRCYRFYHTPEIFDWKLYLDLNTSISPEYRVNEYTTKLHYDLFGYPQGLPYQSNFNNIPDDFDWKMYKKMNKDISDICTNEITSKCHYSEYGIYQSRKYKKTQEDLEMEQSVQEYINHPFLFHKYLLGITSKTSFIPYKEIFTTKYKGSYKLVAHLHCYNIDHFYGFYESYLKQIKQYCGLIIVTFSVGNGENIRKEYQIVLLQCENVGMDIGGKYVCNYYLTKNRIFYDSILFLHSKTDVSLRKLYWEPLINNLSEITKELENESVGIYVPPLVYMGDYACIIYKDHFIEPRNITRKWNFGNSLYVNDVDRYYGLNCQNYMFPEGNCFICKKKIADGLYGNYKDYYLLNSNKTFDAVWVKSYYGGKKLKQIGPTVQEIFRFFKSYRSRPPLYPNNIAWGVGHKGHPDNMYEHVFERMVFKMTQKYGYKIKVMPHNDEPGFVRNLQIFNDKINELMV